MAGPLPVLAMGVLLGLQHATDADHVVAVSTIVARERRLAAAARIGLSWALGHSATVLLAGGAMVATGFVLPARVAAGLELIVALMLVVLGVTGFRRALAARHLLPGEHVPGAHEHASPASAAPTPGSSFRGPATIGVVHGLAGSAALALAVLATVPSRALGLVYLGTFCFGTVLGMSLVTTALAAPVALAAERVRPATLTRIAMFAAATSVLFGGWLAYRVGMADGLLVGVARAALP